MDQLEKRLESLADKQYQKFHSALCPGTNNIMGVRVPVLRKLAKEISNTQDRKYWRQIKDEYYEEIMLQGMLIGLVKSTFEEFLEDLRIWVPKIDNWAVCDVCTAGFKVISRNLEEMWNWIQPYLFSDREFEVRFAIVVLMDYYLLPEYIDKVLEKIETIPNQKQQGYYVKMAIAWLLSVSYVKFPQKTEEYFNQQHLDAFTYEKALQKIIESNRITEEQKEVIRNRKSKIQKEKRKLPISE